MSEKEIERKHHQTFESIRQFNEHGAEFWFARDLQPILDYGSWNKFKNVINKAMTACENAGQITYNHFSQVGKMVRLGSGSTREIEDYQLSRYACYLIVQNGDPAKSVIANGQTYFAIQTRRQELADDKAFQRLREDEKHIISNWLKLPSKQGWKPVWTMPYSKTMVIKVSMVDWMLRGSTDVKG
jgi:DNA-damage-inducible protein D